MLTVDSPIWFDIEPDKLKCKCSYCKRQGNTDEFVYIERGNELPPIIVHKKCLRGDFLTRAEHGTELKKRTVAKYWHARNWPPKIKLIRKAKLDFSIPKELKKPKKH